MRTYKWRGYGCIKNPKSFLGIIRWNSSHEAEILSINPWGDVTWKQYAIEVRCIACGAEMGLVAVDHERLIGAGIEVDKL